MLRFKRGLPDRLRVLWAILALSLATCITCPRLPAGELRRLNVTEVQGVYLVDVEMIVQAAAGDVWRVLTDFTHIYRLNPAITESQVLSSPDEGAVRVRTVVNDCVFIFCIEIERVENVRVTGAGLLEARVVAELSNVTSGTAEWQVVPQGDDCRISYRGRLEPGFTVFPVVGAYFVKSKLREQMRTTLERVESIARIQAEPAVVVTAAP